MDTYFQSDKNKQMLRQLVIKALEKSKYYNPSAVGIDINYFLSQKIKSIYSNYSTTYNTLPPEQYITEMNKRVLEEVIPNLLENYRLLFEGKRVDNLQSAIYSPERFNMLSPDVAERLVSGGDEMSRFITDRNIFIKPTQDSITEMFNMKTRVGSEGEVRADMRQDLMTNDSLLREVAAGYEKTYRMRDKKSEYMIMIDSRDRDRSVYPHPSEYVVALNANDTTPKPHLSRGYKNILTVEVLEITMPYGGNSSTPFQRFPYLLLQIDEMDDTLDGTNVNIRKSIAKLYPRDIRGGDWVHMQLNYRKIYNRNTLGNLNKLTIRITDPDGNLYNFETEETDDGAEPNRYLQNTLTLRITTLEPEVDNVINKI